MENKMARSDYVLTIDPDIMAHLRPTLWLSAGAKGTPIIAPKEYAAFIIPSNGGSIDRECDTGSL
jgi:hypothetical protein